MSLAAPDHHYSGLDRALHRLAFCHRAVQLSAADVEAAVYRRRIGSVVAGEPIFITSLPRAGTTLLLELLSRRRGVASHRYRDMPFVMAPLLWDTLSGPFRQRAILEERAHGDGMQVGFDSPEAFEDILWRTFWPDKFAADHIALWSADEEAEEFRQFFVAHMRTIIALRLGDSGARGRYVSKNNTNIARIGLLKRLLPGSRLLVPFREPTQHAASLLRQHQRFLDVHRTSPFSKRYMEDVGHLEFGALHRPIRFGGVDDAGRADRPDTGDYWIAYWIDAFRHVLDHQDEVILVSYERLCHGGAGALSRVLAAVGLEGDPEAGSDEVVLRPPRAPDDACRIQRRDLLARARAQHDALLALSVV